MLKIPRQKGDYLELATTPAFWFGILLLSLFSFFFSYSYYSNHDYVENSVFRIVTHKATGSGFMAGSKNVIITNEHVISGAKFVEIRYVKNDQFFRHSASVLWKDRKKDLAILKTVDDVNGAPLHLANIVPSQLRKGDKVTAIGFPGAADDLVSFINKGSSADRIKSSKLLYNATVSTGTVQRHVEGANRLMIQHSADIHGGNSGGPLFDTCGRVVGVNTLGRTGETLEAAVHSREVIKALSDRGLSHYTSSGRCRIGLAATGQISLVAIFVLMLGSAVMAAITYYGNPALFLNGFTRLFRSAGKGQIQPGRQNIQRKTANRNRISLELNPTGGGEPRVLSSTKLQRAGHVGLTVGRSDSGADIVINDSSVSRKHAVIYQGDGDRYILNDLGSTNGTRINETPVDKGAQVEIINGDRIRFGATEYVAEFVAHSNTESSDQTIADESPSPSKYSTSGWMLSGFDQKGKILQHEFHLPSALVTGRGTIVRLCSVGRGSANELVIEDVSVSRKHAEISYSSDHGLIMTDLKSSNGSYVDGRKMGSKPVKISNAKNLGFGEVTISLSKLG